jgi:CheY-like chemotaxis protein
LSICKQLVQLWGGEIGLTSQPGQGSTFWFTLPLGLPVQATTLPVAHTERGPKRHYQLTNLNILLAEDIFVNQEVVRIMVKNAGEIIDIANNGQEALAKAQQKKYEVILMDIQMPVLDGLAATKLIRQSVSPVPIIIGLSANAMEGDAERYIAQGMDDYVAKPVDPDALFGKLARWFPSQVKITEQEVVILPPTPVLEPSVPVLNLTVIEKIKALSRNNEAYLKQLFTSFDSDMAQLLAQASASLSANDLPGLASAVHTLKGLAGTIGASQLHELAKIFDHEIKLKQLANAPERLAALREVFAQTQTALFKLLS